MCIKLVSIKELYYDARPTKSQDVVLVLFHSKVEGLFYNALLQPRYDDDSEFCRLSYLVFDAVLTLY